VGRERGGEGREKGRQGRKEEKKGRKYGEEYSPQNELLVTALTTIVFIVVRVNVEKYCGLQHQDNGVIGWAQDRAGL